MQPLLHMRNRYRTNDLVMGNRGVCHQWWYSNGSLVNQYDLPFGGTFQQLLDEETMIDVPEGGKVVKPVIHQKRRQSLYKLDNDTLIQGSNRFDTVGPNAHWNVWGPYGYLVHGNMQIDWSKTTEALARETQDAFYNTNEVDSLLNAVESPELVSSIRPLFSKVNGVKVLGGLTRRGIRNALKQLRDQVGVLSGGYLYYAFGVEPLINDMRKISKAVISYRGQVERELRKSSTVATVRRRCKGTLSTQVAAINNVLPSGWGTGPLDGSGSYWHIEHNVFREPEMICTVRGTRDEQFSTDLFRSLNRLATRFGSSGPASYAWERIPFSFVFDWFVDISGVLNAIDNALTGDRKAIKDICVSQAYGTIVGVVRHQRSITETDSHDGSQVAQVELSEYRRSPIAPGIKVGLSGRFGKKQGLLTAALIGAFAANLGKKKR